MLWGFYVGSTKVPAHVKDSHFHFYLVPGEAKLLISWGFPDEDAGGYVERGCLPALPPPPPPFFLPVFFLLS